MFDLWLKTGQKIVDEIIEESNLKEITKKKFDAFMETEEFKEFIENTLHKEIKKHIEEYAEFYMMGSNGWDEVTEKIKQVIKSGKDTKQPQSEEMAKEMAFMAECLLTFDEYNALPDEDTSALFNIIGKYSDWKGN